MKFEEVIQTEVLRCSHGIMDEASRQYHKRNGMDCRCYRGSRYMIDDKPYCGQHAGVIAIQILIGRAK